MLAKIADVLAQQRIPRLTKSIGPPRTRRGPIFVAMRIAEDYSRASVRMSSRTSSGVALSEITTCRLPRRSMPYTTPEWMVFAAAGAGAWPACPPCSPCAADGAAAASFYAP